MKQQKDFIATMKALYSRGSRTLQPEELKQMLQSLQQNAAR